MALLHAYELQFAGSAQLADWELWGCALTIERHYGSMWEEHVAARLKTLASAGDWAGVATWVGIAARLDRLRDGGSVQ